MKEKNMDPSRWVMATGKTSADVREIASLLEINYKKEASGEYSHSNVIVLLDKEGVKKSMVNGIAADHKALVKAAKQEL
jgi:protein SCO1/2